MKARLNYAWMVTLTILVLSSIYFYRYLIIGNMILGEVSYLDMAVARSLQGPYLKDFFQYTMHHAGSLMELGQALILLSFISGIVSIIFFFKILKFHKMDDWIIAAASLMMVISPFFISSYTMSVRYGFSLMLILAGYYLFLRDSRWKSFLGTILIALFSIMGVFELILAVILFTGIYIFSSRKKSQYWFMLIMLIAILVFHYGPYFLNNGIPHAILPQNLMSGYITDFGGMYGVGIFKLMIALLGFFLYWKQSQRMSVFYVMTIVLAGFTFIYQDHIYLMNPLYSFFAGYALYHYSKARWKLDNIKKLTILVICCGLLFSFLSFFIRQDSFGPSRSLSQSLEWLGRKESGSVLSYYGNGFWIEYFSGLPAVINSKVEYFPYPEKIYNDTLKMLLSRNLKDSRSELFYYDVKYILITPDMKNGKVWVRENDGIVFLFRNTEVFRRIYEKDDIEIWEVLSVPSDS